MELALALGLGLGLGLGALCASWAELDDGRGHFRVTEYRMLAIKLEYVYARAPSAPKPKVLAAH